MTERIRWGIIGTGKIARRMAEALNSLPEAELTAVGSRAKETADAFADTFGIPRRHDSYQALAADPGVDIVYIALPHPWHASACLMCLEQGKAIVCEKPFTVNAAEAEQVVAKAREKKLFLMEAMWTRFLPLMTHLREMVAAGALGDVRMVRADFAFRSEVAPKFRLFNPDLAGGGLLDVGVYTVSFAEWMLGHAQEVASLAHIGETGVDEQCAIALKCPEGRLALLASATRTTTIPEACVFGTEGYARIHRYWWHASRMTVCVAGKEETLDIPHEGNGFEHEAREAMRCLREGRTESPIIPLDDTLAVMRTLDTIRAQWGLKYPFEKQLPQERL